MVLQLDEDSIRTKSGMVASSGSERFLMVSGEQKTGQRTLWTSSKHNQSVRFGGQSSEGNNWLFGAIGVDRRIAQIGIGEQPAEASVTNSILRQDDERGGRGGGAKDRVGDCQLRADYTPHSIPGAGHLKAYSPGQTHIVGKGQARHPYLRCSGYQSLYAASTA